MEFWQNTIDEQLAQFASTHSDMETIRLMEMLRSWRNSSEEQISVLQKSIEELSMQVVKGLPQPNLANAQPHLPPANLGLVNAKEMMEGIPLPALIVGESGNLLLNNSHWLRFFSITEEHLLAIRSSGLVEWLDGCFDPPGILLDALAQ